MHEARATAVELTLLSCSACTLRLESLASTVVLIDCEDVEVDAPNLSALRCGHRVCLGWPLPQGGGLCDLERPCRIYRCANIRAWCKEACDVLEEENARQPAILRRGCQMVATLPCLAFLPSNRQRGFNGPFPCRTQTDARARVTLDELRDAHRFA